MYQGVQIYQKEDKRIISFLRCGHRTIKELKDDNGFSFFKNLPIGPEFVKIYDIYSYTGKTFFVIRDPFEHLLSAITFTMGINYDDSINNNGTFHLLEDEEKLQLTINEIFGQKDNFHWVNKRYQFIYKSIIDIFLEFKKTRKKTLTLNISAKIKGMDWDTEFTFNRDETIVLKRDVLPYFEDIEDYESCSEILNLYKDLTFQKESTII